MPDMRRFKMACQSAIHAAGGLAPVALDLGKSTQQVSNYGNPNTPGNLMTADQMMLVEKISGQPHLARFFAALTGHAVFPLPPPVEGAEAINAAWLEVGAEFGDVAGALRETMADGDFSKADRGRVRSEIDELIAVLITMRALVGG